MRFGVRLLLGALAVTGGEDSTHYRSASFWSDRGATRGPRTPSRQPLTPPRPHASAPSSSSTYPRCRRHRAPLSLPDERVGFRGFDMPTAGARSGHWRPICGGVGSVFTSEGAARRELDPTANSTGASLCDSPRAHGCASVPSSTRGAPMCSVRWQRTRCTLRSMAIGQRAGGERRDASVPGAGDSRCGIQGARSWHGTSISS